MRRGRCEGKRGEKKTMCEGKRGEKKTMMKEGEGMEREEEGRVLRRRDLEERGEKGGKIERERERRGES